MTTLVSAFLSNINNAKNVETYIARGKLLYNVKKPKIFFIDREYLSFFYEDAFTKIYPITKENLYLLNYILNKQSLNTVSLLQNRNKEKDTIEYMCLMCNKTEFLKKAIELNPFNSNQFIWVDFSINHIYGSQYESLQMNDFELNLSFINDIYMLYNKSYDNIRIASIWDLNSHKNINPYENIVWYFAGGIFGGNKNALIEFADLVKNKCIDFIDKTNTLIWEVNIFYLIITEKTIKLFDVYKCDHNRSLILNY